MTDTPIVVINPLGSTLLHYEQELAQTLESAGYSDVEIPEIVLGEGASGIKDKLGVARKTIVERIKMGRATRDRIVIVAWPIFGYFDALTFLTYARANRVFFIVHDPSPLRKSYGYSRFARFVFRVVLARWNMHAIYHTELAREAGKEFAGVDGTVVPHPLLMESTEDAARSDHASRPVVRVLGQYKQTRSVAALEAIAAANGDKLELEIYGRGWPATAGWKVTDGFIAEEDFAAVLQSADCVVIPYDSFYQSGVAVRCLELGVPVVGPKHEHIAELYGPDWPGTVADENDWHNAVLRTLDVDPSYLPDRRAAVRLEISKAWQQSLD